MLPFAVLDVREYLDADGCSPFADWFADLDPTAAAKVTVGLTRIEQGTVSAFKGVGASVLEYRIDFGPGYRVYFGVDGDVLVILQRQQRDIEMAKRRWADYEQRKRRSR